MTMSFLPASAAEQPGLRREIAGIAADDPGATASARAKPKPKLKSKR